MNKIFPASLDKLYEMLSFIRESAKSEGFSEAIISSIELATEEALVNIISYGYPKEAGTIEIDCRQQPSVGLQIIIKDNGVEYDPIKNAKAIDESIPVEKRRVGGYGIFFILNIMDQVHYKRVDHSNVLTMLKYYEKS